MVDQVEKPDVLDSSKKTEKSIWKKLIIYIIVLILAGCLLYFGFRLYSNISTTQKSDTKNSLSSSTTSTVLPQEGWQKNNTMLFQMATSSDTHKLTDSTYRMYLQKDGNIVYTNSIDGITFTTPINTGISAEVGKMLSNPAVLQVSQNNWIMIYEQQPIRQPGTQQGPSGPSNQRNLYLATSTDGKTFSKAGLAIDSGVDDNYFASVPDLVMLPDGDIRMYYVSRGDSIGSAVSRDDGRTWTRETGYRMTNMAVDPDVTIKTENGATKWVMYYSDLDPNRNALYKATSTDGLVWTKVGQVLDSTTSNGVIVDPDVVEQSSNQYVMYFGEAGSSQGEDLNLYSATLLGNIFD